MVELRRQQYPTCYTLAPHPFGLKTTRVNYKDLDRNNVFNFNSIEDRDSFCFVA